MTITPFIEMLVTNGKATVALTVEFTNKTTHYFEKIGRKARNKLWIVQLIISTTSVARLRLGKNLIVLDLNI